MKAIEKKIKAIADLNYVELSEESTRKANQKLFAIIGRRGDVTRFIREADTALSSTDFLYFFNGTSTITIEMKERKNHFSCMGYKK